MYREGRKYGASSRKLVGEVGSILEVLMGRHSDATFRLLDFGCGKSPLVDLLSERAAGKTPALHVQRYDPAIPEFSSPPDRGFDLVINTDVLEHLDENEADLLISDVAERTSAAYFKISTRVAWTFLPNGENAHATVKNSRWWLAKIKAAFPEAAIMHNDIDTVGIFAARDAAKVGMVSRGFRGKPISLKRRIRIAIRTLLGR
jgi:hypothetical protein